MKRQTNCNSLRALECAMADVFDRIADRLQRLAFFNGDLEGLVKHFNQRLIDGGVPVTRVSLGSLRMHPVIGLVDVNWDSSANRIDWIVLPCRQVTVDLFDKAPSGENTKLANGPALAHRLRYEIAPNYF